MKNKLKSLTISSILGDGYLSKERNRGNYLAIQHCDKQYEYLIWKKKRFEEEGAHVSKVYELPKYKANKIHIGGSAIKGLELRHQFYPNGNKTVTRHLLNCLDAEGLAIWFMDDGGKVITHKNGKICGRYLKISTYSFTYDEHLIIQNYFKVVWNIDVKIKKDHGKYYWLKFPSLQAQKLIDIINQYIHPTMEYKIDLKFANLRSNEQPINTK
jgi:hypothetical protein